MKTDEQTNEGVVPGGCALSHDRWERARKEALEEPWIGAFLRDMRAYSSRKVAEAIMAPRYASATPPHQRVERHPGKVEGVTPGEHLDAHRLVSGLSYAELEIRHFGPFEVVK